MSSTTNQMLLELELEKALQELNELKVEKTALEILLEINNKRTDTIEEELVWEREEKTALEICLEMSNEHTNAVEEDLVRENEKKIASFMEAIPVGVLVFDTKGKVDFCNQKALQLLTGQSVPNLTIAQLTNKYPFYITCTKQRYPYSKLPSIRALHGESSSVEDIEIHYPDGKIIPIEILGVPIYDKKGQVSHAITIFQDITERKQAEEQRKQFTQKLEALNISLEEKVAKRTAQLRQKNKLIRQVFGRYLSNEIVETLLETESGLALGGQRQEVTLLTSDIRGFTAQTDNLPPEQVVKIINFYLTAMADIIDQYQGTIDDFMGDGILILFGAPTARVDDPQRAVACAVAMQLAMIKVNEQIQAWGYAPLEMGIGINTAEVIVGNIGSEKRTKYTVIGNEVNLTYRIESYTTGGQVFISESTFQKVGNLIKIQATKEVQPKGVKKPITIYEVAGIGGKYDLYLEREEETFISLKESVPLQYSILEGKHVGDQIGYGRLLKVSVKGALIQCDKTFIPESFTNLKINLNLSNSSATREDIYAKVISDRSKENTFHIHFTYIPINIKILLIMLFKLEWTPDLSINHPIIDQQHQQLFILFRDLITCLNCHQQRTNIIAIINSLISHLITNFESEEQLMKQYDYPHYTIHQSQHTKLIKKIHEVRLEYEQNHSECFYLVFQVHHKLVDWFINHITQFDKQLGQFLKEKNSAMKVSSA